MSEIRPHNFTPSNSPKLGEDANTRSQNAACAVDSPFPFRGRDGDGVLNFIMQKPRIYIWLLLLLVLTSCMKDDELWDVESNPRPEATSGVFVVCEGNFTYQNASLSFYDPESKTVENDAFYHANSLPLGDVAQSIAIHDSLAWIVINNSGKVYAMNLDDFSLARKITGLASPRYMHFLSDSKAYISDLYAGAITIVNPQTFEITGYISLADSINNSAFSSEQFVQFGQFVFTTSWSFGKHVLVIDSETDQLVDSIRVIAQPNSLVLDKYNKLWVLSDGGQSGNPNSSETPGLTRIDATTLEVEQTFLFPDSDNPTELCINHSGDTLYFLNRHLYRHPITSTGNPEIFIESPYTGSIGGYYGLGIDPATSEIYIADAIDHVQQGLVYRFRANGRAVDTLRVGVIPGAIGFWE